MNLPNGESAVSSVAGSQQDALSMEDEAEVLRQRLEEAEETLRAVLAGEVDTIRPPGHLDHRLLREARSALKRISHRYEEVAQQRDAVLDALPAQMVLLDGQGRVVATNRLWRQTADARGFRGADHGLGTSYLEVCAAADPVEAPNAPIVERALRELLAGRRDAFVLEYPIVDPARRTQWYRLMASPLPQRRGVVVLHLDVTQNRLAEEARVHSERRWRQLVQTLPDALFLVEDGRVGFANEAAARVLGTDTAARLQGRSWDSLVDPADLEVGLALLQAAETSRRRPAVELRLVRDGGGHVEVEVSVAPLPAAAGSSLLLIARDVSRRKEAERTLQQLNDRLVQAQKLEAVGRLAGGVAHDFNNLLTAINGFGELLIAQFEEGDPRLLHAREIRKAGERAAILTRQLLTFGRRQRAAPEVFSLDTRLRDVERMLRRTIGEDIDLVLDLRSEGSYVCADPNQVEQAIVNLVVNARDAMPRGGRLTLVTRSVEVPLRDGGGASGGVVSWSPGNGQIAGRDEDRSRVLLAVRDSGEGIPHEILPYIFEPFFTTKERDKGTGLGLAMVYGVLQDSRGEVEVESALGGGTEVRLYFPSVRPPEADPGGEVAESSSVPAEAATILVVEDEPAVRDLVDQVLRSAGHRLLKAEDGRRAEILAREAPHLDLLLTDVILPGMNGREVAERVASLHPETPVLFMTGYSNEELVARTRSGLGSDVLGKPFTPEQLLARVEQALQRGGR